MADKFPELDIETSETPVGSEDFLQRERELLGETFAEANGELEASEQTDLGDDNGDDDDDFDDFSTPATAAKADSPIVSQEPVDFVAPVSLAFENLNLADSQHIKAWKEKRDAEIASKEAGYERSKKDTLAEAEKSLDAFYETYNSKREQAVADAKKAEEKFISERDVDTTGKSIWDSAVGILGLDKNTQSVDDDLLRDKTRFKEILLALKGKTNVSGSA